MTYLTTLTHSQQTAVGCSSPQFNKLSKLQLCKLCDPRITRPEIHTRVRRVSEFAHTFCTHMAFWEFMEIVPLCSVALSQPPRSGAKNLTYFSVFTQKMSDVRSKCPLFFTFPFVFFSNRYMITCKNKLFIEPGILVFQKAWIFPVLKLPLSLLSWARSVFLSTFVTFFSSWNALEF